MKNLKDIKEIIVWIMYITSVCMLCLSALQRDLIMTIASGVIVLSLGLLLIAKSTPRITINNNYK